MVIPEIDKRYFLMTNKASKSPNQKINDIAICCPICKEGRSWNRKQRCHLYVKRGMNNAVVNCFNCGFSGKIGTYLKSIDPGLYHTYLNETRKDAFDSLSVDTMLNRTAIKNESKDVKILKLKDFGFTKATDSKRAMSYLYKRAIPTKNFKHFWYAYEVKVEMNGKKTILRDGIIAPLWYNSKEDEIYGFQYRSIERKQFLTFLPDENSGYKCYNYFESSRKKLYVFESIFDLMSVDIPLENKVAVLGSDLPDILYDNVKEIILTFDNTITDHTAREKVKKIVNKYTNVSAFIWPSNMVNYKDFNSILQNAVKNGIKDSCKKLKKIIEHNTYTGLDAFVRLNV